MRRRAGTRTGCTWLASRASSSDTSLRSAAMRRFLRQARGIDLRFAEKILQARFQAARECGPGALGEHADAGGVDSRWWRGGRTCRRAGRSPSCSRIWSSLSSASVRQRATAGSRRAISSSDEAAASGGADHAGQAQDRSEIGFGLNAELRRAGLRRLARYARRDFLIHGDGGRARPVRSAG